MVKYLPLIFLLFFCFPGNQAVADTDKCPNTNAQVTYQVEDDFHHACKAAEKTFSFMTSQGFLVDNIIRISLTDTIHNKHTPAVYGYYSTRENTVNLLSYAAFLTATSGQTIFGTVPDTTIYQSFIVHEVAHAIAHHNFTIANPPPVAHEYIAYVVQIATLPVSVQQKILINFRYGAFENHREINSIYFSLSPENFAIKSYLHFIQPENGRIFLATILSKDILDRCSIRYNC